MAAVKRCKQILILIFVLNIMNVDTFILRDTYNVLLKEKVDYKVDLMINEDDYEMIDKHQMKDFNVEKKLFSKFDEIARNEYLKLLKTTNMNSDDRETKLPIIIKRRTKKKVRWNAPFKYKSKKNKGTVRYVPITKTNKKITTLQESDLQYNYNDLLNEYYEQPNNEAIQETSEQPEYGVMNSLKKILVPRYQKNVNYNKSIGLVAIKTLLEEYKEQRRPKIDIAYRLWRIFQIWFLVYLAFAIPLWCTRGWCCCCLFCKFFKPHQTIDAAKKYLITNPPGIFKTKNGDVVYEPSEREKETYEEFDHFLKTS